jgi:hypothetical protein
MVYISYLIYFHNSSVVLSYKQLIRATFIRVSINSTFVGGYPDLVYEKIKMYTFLWDERN